MKSSKARDPDPTPQGKRARTSTRRPRKRANGQADAADENIASAEFFDQVAEISDWQRHRLYVYRIWPVLMKGDPHYIATVSQAVDESYLLSHFGSGRYLVMLKDQQTRKLVAKHTVACYSEEHPPKLNPLHLAADDPQNDAYFQTWGSQAKRPDGAKPATNGGDTAAAEAVRELATIVKGFQAQGRELDGEQRELFMDAARQAIDVVKSQYGARETASATPTQIIELLSKAKELLVPPKAETRSTSSDLALLREMRSLVAETLEHRGESPGPQNSVQQMQEMLTLLKSMQDTFGNRASEPKWWEALLPTVPQALDRVDSIVRHVVAMRGLGPQTKFPPAALRPGTDLASPPFSTAGLEAGQLKGATTSEASAPDTASGFQALTPEVQAFMSQLAGPLLNALNNGAHGSDFASWVSDGYGRLTYDQLRSLGKETLLAALQSFPPLWEHLKGHQVHLGQFLDQFLSGPEADNQPEDDLPEEDELPKAA